MVKNNPNEITRYAGRKELTLDRRYGEIGISAVAAALPYQSEVKNPAYAPVSPQPDKRLIDATS